MQKKVIYITNIPAPYRVAMLNYAQKMLTKKGIILKVIFTAETYPRRDYWKGSLHHVLFPFEILKSFHFQLGSEKMISLGWSVQNVLQKESPSLIISTGFSFPTIFACRYAKKNNIPFYIHSGETLTQEQRRFGRRIRKIVRRYLLSNCTACIAYGTEAKKFLNSYGVNDDQIYIAINSIDTEEFQTTLQNIKNIKKDPNDKIEILFVGNLQRMKGIEYVLHSLKLLEVQHNISVTFNIIGRGPYKTRLEQIRSNLSLNGVIFWGAMEPVEVIPFYVKNDIFIFPSLYDVFGLVMVEAAAAGLPIIASKFAGGSVDIVKDWGNGFIVDPTDVNQLAEKIKELCENSQKRKEMGRYSLKMISESVNIHRSAEGFTNSIIKYL